MADDEKRTVGVAIGGAVVGGVLGGPVGAVIGFVNGNEIPFLSVKDFHSIAVKLDSPIRCYLTRVNNFDHYNLIDLEIFIYYLCYIA